MSGGRAGHAALRGESRHEPAEGGRLPGPDDGRPAWGRWLWETPWEERIQKGLVVLYSLLVPSGLIVTTALASPDIIVPHDREPALWGALAALGLFGLLEGLVWGLLGLLLYLWLLPPGVRRVCLRQWAGLQVEMAVLAVSLLAEFAVLALWLLAWGDEGMAGRQDVGLSTWLLLLLRMIHHLARLSITPQKKAIMRVRQGSIAVTPSSLLAALDSVEGLQPNTYLHLQGLLLEFISVAVDGSGRLVELDGAFLATLHTVLEGSNDRPTLSGLSHTFLSRHASVAMPSAAADELPREHAAQQSGMVSPVAQMHLDSFEHVISAGGHSPRPKPPELPEEGGGLGEGKGRTVTVASGHRRAVCEALLAEASSAARQSWSERAEAVVCGAGDRAYSAGGALLSALRWMGRHPLSSGATVIFVGVNGVLGVTLSASVGYVSGQLATFNEDTPLGDYLWIGGLLGMSIIGFSGVGGVVFIAIGRMLADLQDDIGTLMFQASCGKGTAAAKVGAMTEGDITSRYARDTTAFLKFMMKTLPWSILYNATLVVASMVTLVSFSWELAICFVIIIPVSYGVTSGAPVKRTRTSTEQTAALQGAFSNCIALRRLVALYGCGDFVLDHYRDARQLTWRLQWEAELSKGLATVAMLLWSACCQCFAFLYIMLLARLGYATRPVSEAITATTTSVLLILNLARPISSLSEALSEVVGITTPLWRIDEATGRLPGRHSTRTRETCVAQQAEGSTPNSEEGELPPLSSAVELNGVELRYPSTAFRSGEPAVRGISARFRAGSYTCIVGFSGAGKTSLLKLLTREQIETSGCVTFDGVALTAIPMEAVREQLGVVLQETEVLGGTIADNIRMGTGTTATREDVEAAAKAAECHGFISSLPDGYGTHLGGEALTAGPPLSGGQLQRICLARALCRRPRLLLLDEATSALDTNTEAAIIETVVRLAREGMTVVSVTHRMATTAAADQVLVLGSGTVLEAGRPEELLRREGVYHQLCTAASSRTEGGQPYKSTSDVETVIPREPGMHAAASEPDVSSAWADMPAALRQLSARLGTGHADSSEPP